ncbi:MAG: DUF3795 domain-containing protein [Phycisphaerales bacterium]
MKKIDLIAYCGLDCGKCPGYTQIPANLAVNLNKELAKGKFDKVADFLSKMQGFEGFEYYKQGVELLNSIEKLRCKGCRKGGGSPDCKIRICAKQKKYKGCWECEKFESCGNFQALQDFENGKKTYLKNLKKIKKYGLEKFVKNKLR